ncbi:hypothetical protein [Poseidonocella sedimentorum]|uniref:Uncharacterized protein n=1 Tax=Poseidonocella sedimentorum TaxID=871652 RepID=A0A1I6CW84_9RHOB|nr:hypothetical protein [Poseidonocella sedimentorum]SFQ97456.1 hypothetical protein SAMN04515673_101479 [Poseidonocella sedimentorum]
MSVAFLHELERYEFSLQENTPARASRPKGQNSDTDESPFHLGGRIWLLRSVGFSAVAGEIGLTFDPTLMTVRPSTEASDWEALPQTTELVLKVMNHAADALVESQPGLLPVELPPAPKLHLAPVQWNVSRTTANDRRLRSLRQTLSKVEKDQDQDRDLPGRGEMKLRREFSRLRLPAPATVSVSFDSSRKALRVKLAFVHLMSEVWGVSYLQARGHRLEFVARSVEERKQVARLICRKFLIAVARCVELWLGPVDFKVIIALETLSSESELSGQLTLEPGAWGFETAAAAIDSNFGSERLYFQFL